MQKNLVASSRQIIEGMNVRKEDYFVNLSQESILEIIMNKYSQNIVGMKETVQKYTGHPVYPSVPDSKIVAAYQRIKQPKFATVNEILNILK